mgnify:CR=1 FL=1
MTVDKQLMRGERKSKKSITFSWLLKGNHYNIRVQNIYFVQSASLLTSG